MCRFVAFNTDLGIDPNVARAIVEAARSDPLSVGRSHPDGWGVAALIKFNGSWSQIYYRSDKPIYEDPFLLEVLHLIEGRKSMGIIHARRALRKELRGVGHSHPYYIKSGPIDLFYAHNGSVVRKAFEDPSLPYTDSYVLLMEIAKLVNSLSPGEVLKAIVDNYGESSTSLNSALLYYSLSSVGLVSLSYYNKSRAREEDEYYKLYRWEGYVASSSVARLLGVGEPLKNGEVVEL